LTGEQSGLAVMVSLAGVLLSESHCSTDGLAVAMGGCGGSTATGLRLVEAASSKP
jgi:hypothetical protein